MTAHIFLNIEDLLHLPVLQQEKYNMQKEKLQQMIY